MSEEEYIAAKTRWNLNDFKQKMDPYCADILRAIVSCRVHNHDEIEQFNILHKAVIENLDDIIEKWNSRWMLSIIDTYADMGKSIERSNATLISHVFNSVRMFDSYLELCHNPSMDEEYFQTIKQIPLWDGFLTFNLRYGNTMENCFARIDGCLNNTPHLKRMYEELLTRMMQADNIFATLCKNHQNDLIGTTEKERIIS